MPDPRGRCLLSPLVSPRSSPSIGASTSTSTNTDARRSRAREGMGFAPNAVPGRSVLTLLREPAWCRAESAKRIGLAPLERALLVSWAFFGRRASRNGAPVRALPVGLSRLGSMWLEKARCGLKRLGEARKGSGRLEKARKPKV